MRTAGRVMLGALIVGGLLFLGYIGVKVLP